MKWLFFSTCMKLSQAKVYILAVTLPKSYHSPSKKDYSFLAL